MSSVILSGLTTITTISLFDGWGNITDILDDIRKIGCWIHQSLPENRVFKLAIYGFGTVLFIRSLPFILRRTEFFAYYERQAFYFHRSNGLKEIVKFKKEVLKELKDGDHNLPLFEEEKLVILELNIGGGTNLTYYPDGAFVIGTDFKEDSKELLEANFLLEKNLNLLQYLDTRVEELNNVPDSSVSCVISIHSLCSARNTDRALGEIMRVLMPGGKLYFIEHTTASKRFTAMWIMQMNFRPSMFLVGCCIKKIEPFIYRAGFSKVFCNRTCVNMETMIGPLRALAPHVYGVAVK